MSYRVPLAGSVLARMKDLPDHALTALVERAADLVDEPWDAQVLYPGRRGYRQAVFGGFGVIHFHVDEPAELITVYELDWTG
ncbi:hypothetical protein [Microbispora sp. NPDC049125]|uniref:hypothetical protein n=1 Tax=Microbispora sp. NPDC049125 TaxID=3154929 RepID=UPI003466EA54